MHRCYCDKSSLEPESLSVQLGAEPPGYCAAGEFFLRVESVTKVILPYKTRAAGTFFFRVASVTKVILPYKTRAAGEKMRFEGATNVILPYKTRAAGEKIAL